MATSKKVQERLAAIEAGEYSREQLLALARSGYGKGVRKAAAAKLADKKFWPTLGYSQPSSPADCTEAGERVRK